MTNQVIDLAEQHIEAYERRQLAARLYLDEQDKTPARERMRIDGDREAPSGAAVVYAIAAVLLVGVLVGLIVAGPLLR